MTLLIYSLKELINETKRKTEIKPEDDIENENIIFFQCKRIIQVRVETGSKRAKKNRSALYIQFE